MRSGREGVSRGAGAGGGRASRPAAHRALPALVIAVLLVALGAGLGAAPSISAVVNTGIRDFRASATLSEANLAALKKIGSDYANAYRCRVMDAYFKEPGRIRFEMRALGITFTYVINGNVKYTAIPQLHIRQTMDISKRPQTRQNSMELGFLTPGALRDFTTRTLRRQDGLLVFELRYRQADQRGKKILLWVDPEKKLLARRELYHSDGTLKARFTYSRPTEAAPGIWVPTRITVHNGEGELGGATTYHSIRLNTGLPDRLFEGI